MKLNYEAKLPPSPQFEEDYQSIFKILDQFISYHQEKKSSYKTVNSVLSSSS